MTDYTKLVKRLKENTAWLRRDGFLTNAANTAEAAQAIEALVAENARLEKDYLDLAERRIADLATLRTENERLKAEVECEERRFCQLFDDFAALSKELAALNAQESVAWMVMNGLADYQLVWSKKQADALAAKLQKDHDLSGSLAAFSVAPLFKLAPRDEQGE